MPNLADHLNAMEPRQHDPDDEPIRGEDIDQTFRLTLPQVERGAAMAVTHRTVVAEAQANARIKS